MTIGNNVFIDAMDLASKGAKSAVGTVNKLIGEPEDKSLRVYKQLQPTDFTDLIETFGEETALEYIRKMETKLAKQK